MNLAGDVGAGVSRRDARRYADRAQMIVVASAPRVGRLARQCKRAFLAQPNLSMRELIEWCYAGRTRQHWFYRNIKRALRSLGAVQIGRANGRGRPAIYATRPQHEKNTADNTKA